MASDYRFPMANKITPPPPPRHDPPAHEKNLDPRIIHVPESVGFF